MRGPLARRPALRTGGIRRWSSVACPQGAAAPFPIRNGANRRIVSGAKIDVSHQGGPRNARRFQESVSRADVSRRVKSVLRTTARRRTPCRVNVLFYLIERKASGGSI